MRQHEITRARPLLDSRGNIAEPGYAKRLLPVYRRADVKARASSSVNFLSSRSR